MSKARELASLGNAYSDGALSNRNLIINGAMQVWQRGTSHTASGGYSADRWWMANATSVARSTEAPEGFTYSAFITASGGGNDSIGQPIELTTGSSSPMVAGQKVTVSLYAKTVSGTDDIAATINFRDAKYSGTNQSAFGNGDTWTVTTTWQRFTTTFTVPLINPTNVLAGLEIFGIGSSMYITGVQLEVGDTATPFEHRSYGQELALCQRYYWNNFGSQPASTVKAGNSPDNRCTIATLYNGVELQCAPISFNNTMRTSPSIIYYKPAHISTSGRWGVYGPTNGWGAGMPISGYHANQNGVTVMLTSASGVSDFQSFIVSGYLEADAEL